MFQGFQRFAPSDYDGKTYNIFDLDGAHEVIKNGANGFLIKPEDEEELAEKIIYLCNNPDLIINFGKFGKVFIGDQFSSSKMVEQIENLYQEFFNKPI